MKNNMYGLTPLENQDMQLNKSYCDNSVKNTKYKLSFLTGFTLIELLIVVAIISILSAIAIPNFMTAQTRAKVADVKSALRTGMLGLEAYYVDQNNYPPMREWMAVPNRTDCYEYPMEITTPVAYITSRPTDPFNMFEGNHLAIKYHHPGIGLHNGSLTELGFWVPRAFPGDEGSDATDILYQGTVDSGTQRPAIASPVKYALWSSSPNDRSWKLFTHKPVPQRLWYDPTNGNTSLGFIVRLSDSR